MHVMVRSRAARALAVAAAALVSESVVATDDAVDDLVRETVEVVRQRYIDIDAAERAAELVEGRAAHGAYDGTDPRSVARAMTRALQEATNDLHFRMSFDPKQFAYLQEKDGSAFSPTSPEERLRAEAMMNFGFTEVRIAAGNVGYLKLDSFCGEPGAVEKAHAVMAFLGDADGVIVDLRDNGGGWSTMERLICSYFLPPDDEDPLLVFTTRHTGKTKQVWMHDWLPQDRILDVPVVVLTSDRTFSAAEGVAYQLSVRGRAKVVGERSAGGANGVEFVPLVNNYVLKIPTTSGIVPLTGSNWEAVGVDVDVECVEDKALERAHLVIVETLLEDCDERDRPALQLIRDRLAGGFSDVAIPEDTLRACQGVYGGQSVRFRDGALWFKPPGTLEWSRMNPIDARTFMVEGRDDFKVAFEEAEGQTFAIVELADGRRLRLRGGPLPEGADAGRVGDRRGIE